MRTKTTFRVEFGVKGTVNISYYIPAYDISEAFEIAEKYMKEEPSHFYICKIEKVGNSTILNEP